MSTKQLKLLWTLTIAALLVMLLYLANHLSALMDIDESKMPGCTMEQGSCTVTLSSGDSVRLSVSPWPVLALKPVEFSIMADNVRLTSAKLALTGRTMYMGIHQYTLRPFSDSNTLAVNGTISVCTEKVMPWRGRVELETDRGTEHIWFDFDVLQM
ncbi:hypothetical protein [Oceanospirillum linum]|uniref:Uncharacterized protein n=1 Tax=Oceanospirillum linum TaxID=966 RepID=A0A1T1H8L2_OCELI|nr:hypothetical protein [Oceanospirillum linum]OOV86168.1 hypothetical protein BTA35_0214395 [Oceanospirillum linum]SEG38959.1 hypothetical protein SAMN04489856_109104 [Oleiphilus messinensis]SMP31798.1 hypothetical protein SAMN06264348_10925 [Oceanospirillum linum]